MNRAEIRKVFPFGMLPQVRKRRAIAKIRMPRDYRKPVVTDDDRG